jgi:arylsulfatase A-like enzyme
MAALCPARASEVRPNIIYINIDDLGWADLGVQGSKFYQTPNIDRLAAEGLRFTQAYSPASNCAPSRASCLTGQYTPRHGIYTVGTSERGDSKDRQLIPTPNKEKIKDGNITIAQVLRGAGYTTASIGKWHISEAPTNNGFDINIAGSNWGQPKKGYFSPYEMPYLENGPEKEYLTDRLTDEALRFIREHKDRPFFLYLAHYGVHTPLQAPAELKKKYADADPAAPQHNADYAAMIESVDTGIGRLMTALRELGLDEKTLVLFTSDNGGVRAISQQLPLRAGKGAYYEGGIRVPLILRWPEVIPAGATSEVPVIGVDFFPTFAELAGASLPTDKVLDGVSLVPLLTGKGGLPERPLFWHFPIYLEASEGKKGGGNGAKFRCRPGSAVRVGSWKLLENFEDGALELYDLSNDIGERANLAEANPEKTRELLQLLRAWRRSTGAPVPDQRNPQFKN